MVRLRRAISLRRIMAAIAVFALLMSAVKAAYQPCVYIAFAQLQVIPPADHNPAAMNDHAGRLTSPEVLAAASADPALPPRARPLRAARGDEVVTAASVPCVYASVRSAPSWTISLQAEAMSQEETKAVALAVINAYIRDQGACRVKLLAPGPSSMGYQSSSPLSQPSEVAMCAVISFLVSAAILLLPLPTTWRSRMFAVAAAVYVAVLVAEAWYPPMTMGRPVSILVGGVVACVIGVAAVRHPWIALVIGSLVWVASPTIYHSYNIATQSASGCILGWIIGAPCGWISRAFKKPVAPSPDLFGPTWTAPSSDPPAPGRPAAG